MVPFSGSLSCLVYYKSPSLLQKKSRTERTTKKLKGPTQGAGRVVDLPKIYMDTNSCIFWCKMTLGTTFMKGVLPVVGEPK